MRKMFVLLALLIASAAGAAEHSDLYIVPIAGHARGLFDTAWRTDVTLHNLQDVAIHVELALVEDATLTNVGSAIELAPGETHVLADVLGSLGRDAIGALIAGADMPFVLTSRTYAVVGTGRTLGQTVLPVAIGGSADAMNGRGILAGLARGEQQRANIGMFVASSSAPLIVQIDWLSSTGAVLSTQFVTVTDAGFAHRQLPVLERDAATAVLRIVEGDGIVVPYASIVDNHSAEAAFVAEEAVTSGGAAAVATLRSAMGTH